LYHTIFASPQLELIELDDAHWIKVQQRALHRRTHLMMSRGEQLTLAGLGASALVALYVQALVTFQIKQRDFFQILWRGHEPQGSTLGI
jgi:hypothetical protein